MTTRSGLAARARRAGSYRLEKTAARGRWLSRRATARARLRPNFLVVGAQKAGTTSLHRYLAEHPAVLPASVKEVRYFNRFYTNGEAWYLAHFPLALRGAAVRRRLGVRPAVGESSAVYLFDPRVPARVHTFDPAMKLVVLLRDPVERAYSHYQMEVRWGRETLPFDEALDREEAELPGLIARALADPLDTSDVGFPRSYVGRGRYAEQLDRWLELFPREQLLVETSDDLLERPREVMQRVAAHLVIPAHDAQSYPLEGVRPYPPLDDALRDRLESAFACDNRRLEELLGRDLGWARAPGVRPGGVTETS
jgi:Sulfotransferase domain